MLEWRGNADESPWVRIVPDDRQCDLETEPGLRKIGKQRATSPKDVALLLFACGLYSARKVSAGLIAATRRVGTIAATKVTANRIRTTAKMVRRSYTPTP